MTETPHFDTASYGSRVGDLAARLFGWRIAMLADPAVTSRWLWLRRHARRGVRTLDAGSGSGWFAFYLSSLGNVMVGISFNPIANAAARRRARALGLDIEFVDGDLRELDQIGPPLGEFAQVVCFETIEHILDDAKLVRDLAALVAPGGRLLLTTPSDDHRALISDDVAAVEEGGHVRFGYSFAELRRLCEAAGLRVITETRLTGWIGQRLFNVTAHLTKVIPFRLAVALTIPLRPLQVLDPIVTKLLRERELVVAIIAERPPPA